MVGKIILFSILSMLIAIAVYEDYASARRDRTGAFVVRSDSDDVRRANTTGTPSTRTVYEEDSLLQPHNVIVYYIGDTVGSYINRDIVGATIQRGTAYLLHDSSFVWRGIGCIKISGILGITADVPDTIQIEDTCMTACFQDFVVPLGCWDTLRAERLVTQTRWIADTTCYIWNNADANYILLTRAELEYLKAHQQAWYGIQCDTSRVSPDPQFGGIYKYNFCLHKESANQWKLNLAERNPAYNRSVPAGTFPDTNYCCIDAPIALLWLYSDTTRIARIVNGNAAWEEVSCDDYRGVPGIRKEMGNYRDTTVTVITQELTPVWVSAGRDTSVSVNTCLYQCPKFILNCNGTGTGLTTKVDSVFDYAINWGSGTIDTACQRPYAIIDSIVGQMFKPAVSALSHREFQTIWSAYGCASPGTPNYTQVRYHTF